MEDELREKVREKLEALPLEPGVYIMKNAAGQVIYVGKARSLRHRVRQYFQNSRNQEDKLLLLVPQIADIETIITDSELEALVLECNLIKRYRPRFNVMLKDDKSYPCIRVDMKETYPRVSVTRSIKKDAARYYGPYPSGRALRETMEALRKVFPARSCTRKLAYGRQVGGRPCLYHHLGQCPAPCQGDVDPDAYRENILALSRFLDGKDLSVMDTIREEMISAAQRLQFEKAARLRDRIRAMEVILERQKMASPSGEDRDVIGLSRVAWISAVQVLRVREGAVIGGYQAFMENAGEETAAETLYAFLTQYYDARPGIPREIMLPGPVIDQDVVEPLLARQRGGPVHLRVPERGNWRKLVDLAERNAEKEAQRRYEKESQQEARTTGAVKDLAEALGITREVKRIEGYDISHIQGVETVASMVVFVDGSPEKKSYRRFKIRGLTKPDDFESMAQVIRRRFSHAIEEREKLKSEGKPLESGRFSVLPDLILIDGGKGQLSAAVAELTKLDISLPIFGLAKQFEEVYLPGKSEPVILPRTGYALHLIQRVRDEAHRFAVSYHRGLRDRGTLYSQLEEIPGIGPRRRQALLKYFGSMRAIAKASVADMKAVAGMNEKAARAVRDFFDKEGSRFTE